MHITQLITSFTLFYFLANFVNKFKIYDELSIQLLKICGGKKVNLSFCKTD